MTPWLSILIPVYNVEKYLEECLQSILSQVDDGVEIIILDDKSTDNSASLLGDMAKTYVDRIKIIRHSEHRGVSAARNTLLAAAVGDYLWFVDSDDVLSQGAVAQLRRIVKKDSPDLIMCDYRIWYSEEKLSSEKSKAGQQIQTFSGLKNVFLEDPIALFNGLFKRGKLQVWSKISKRQLWHTELLFPEGKYFEDMVVTPRLALVVKSYFYIPEAWVYYRKRPGSILSMPSSEKIEQMNAGVDGIWDMWLKKHPEMDSTARYIFTCYCVKIFFFTIKELKKIENLNSPTLKFYRERLYKNTGHNKYSLIVMYLSRGNIAGLIKLARFL